MAICHNYGLDPDCLCSSTNRRTLKPSWTRLVASKRAPRISLLRNTLAAGWYRPIVNDQLLPHWKKKTSRWSVAGQQWKVHRKMLNPSFSYNITNQFLPIFNKHIRTMIKCIKNKCDQPAFDILHVLKNCSMDMICGEYWMENTWDPSASLWFLCCRRDNNGYSNECTVQWQWRRFVFDRIRRVSISLINNTYKTCEI